MLLLYLEDVENSYWTLDPDLYEDLQVSDCSDGEGSVPVNPPRDSVPRILVIRSGNLVRRVRLGILDWTQRKKNYKRILSSIKQRVTKMKGSNIFISYFVELRMQNSKYWSLDYQEFS